MIEIDPTRPRPKYVESMRIYEDSLTLRIKCKTEQCYAILSHNFAQYHIGPDGNYEGNVPDFELRVQEKLALLK